MSIKPSNQSVECHGIACSGVMARQSTNKENDTMYVIKRTDQGGGYVNLPGSKSSYTKSIERARKYDSRQAAEEDLCPGNEVVVEFCKWPNPLINRKG